MEASVGVKIPPTIPNRISSVMSNAQNASIKLLLTFLIEAFACLGCPFFTDMMNDTTIKPIANNKPGIAPARNNLPMDSPLNEPAIIMGILGGMMGPMVLEDAVTAQEKSDS